MRTIPTAAQSNNVREAHLFEIELAIVTILAKINSTKYIVDDIDKCFVGMKISKAYFDGVHRFDLRTVTAIDVLTNQITIDTAFTTDASDGDAICETIYDTNDSYAFVDSTQESLELYHAALGTFTGKITVTDYDMPVVTPVYRDALRKEAAHYEGNIVYLPVTISYQGTEQDNKGKSSSIELSMTNIDQLLGNLILTHNALKERAITVKTVYFDDNCSLHSILLPVEVDSYKTYVGRSNGQAEFLMSYNPDFTSYVYAPAINVVTEFEGTVDNASADNKTASLQATVAIDSTENYILPARMYNRLRCPFIYKSWRCRFNSKLVLNENIAADKTGKVEFKSNDLFFYFKGLQKDETHIIRIGEELIVINKFEEVSGISAMDNEDVRKLSYADVAAKITAGENRFYLYLSERGYGDTNAAAYNSGVAVDILLCKKTDHDCNMHGHDAYFGAFPAIPKNKNYAG